MGSAKLHIDLTPRTPPPLRIALLSPKGPLYRYRSGIFGKSLRAAPLTLSTLAALIPPELDAEVAIYDEGVEEIPEDLKADLIGMTVITGNAPRAYELSKLYRSRGIPVVLGGPHVTLVPEDAKSHCDCLVTGYAEETWPKLLRDFKAGCMKSRYDMSPDFSFTKLPEIPIARRELLKKRTYQPVATIEATRGCVHKCEFCVVPSAWGTHPYQKPIEHVIDEIRKTGKRKIIFYDLNLLADFEYARELFTALIPLKIRWFGLATVLLGRDPELMELVSKSGCRGLLIGFESVCTDGLSQHNKPFNNPADYGSLVADLHLLGIAINGTFVFGSDAEDRTVFEQVKDFVLQHRIDLPRFAVLTPFPGTPLFRRLDADGRILSTDWGLYDGQHVVFQPAKMSVETLQSEHERVWQEVYSFGGIFQRLKHRYSTLPFLAAANLAYRFYANNLSRCYTCHGGAALSARGMP